jgi:CubicO group peptidase (beta-lactamase class C family)
MINRQKDLVLAEITAVQQGQQVQVCGTITDRRLVAAKERETFCVLTLEDHTGSIQVVVLPPVYQPSSTLYERGTEVVLSGKIEVRQKMVNVLCSAIRAANAPAPSRQQQVLLEVEQYLSQVQRDLHLPGLAVGIVQDGEVIFLHGSGNAAPGRAMTPQTPFVLGSISKTFTAIAVMQLVQAGKVNLDASIQRYIPWFRVADPAASALITVRHLLSHTSGLSRYDGRALLGGRGEKTLEQSVRDLAAMQLTQPVGARFQYSNLNYAVLGILVQVVAGMAYETYIQRHIFERLHMEHSYTSEQTTQTDGMAEGYRWWFGLPLPGRVPYLANALPAAFLISSAQDMTKYLQACLDAGADDVLLSAASFAELYRPQAAITAHASYALGWRVEELGNETIIRHSGETANFLTELVMVPAHRLGVVVLLNCNNGAVAQLGVARIATALAGLFLDVQPTRPKLSFQTFYVLTDLLVLALTSLQVWLLFHLAVSVRTPLSLADGVVLVASIVVPVLALWRLPRLKAVDSPWTLLRWYVPDLSVWVWTMCVLSLLIVMLSGIHLFL